MGLLDRRWGCRHPVPPSLPPIQMMALGIVPMCSYQSERMFNTTRIPGKETGMGGWGGTQTLHTVRPRWGPGAAGWP